MLTIGLTGGVGAGKSRVLAWLEKEWGAGVIRTDEVARGLMEPGEEGYVRVVKALGTSFLNQEGVIDRPALAQLIFRDHQARETVNAITHPLVWEEVKQKLALARKEGRYSVMVVESALFDESALSFLEEIWYVYASKEVRIQRLMENRGYSREKCLSILASQRSEQEFRALSSLVIDNTGDWDKTREKLAERIRERKKANFY